MRYNENWTNYSINSSCGKVEFFIKRTFIPSSFYFYKTLTEHQIYKCFRDTRHRFHSKSRLNYSQRTLKKRKKNKNRVTKKPQSLNQWTRGNRVTRRRKAYRFISIVYSASKADTDNTGRRNWEGEKNNIIFKFKVKQLSNCFDTSTTPFTLLFPGFF